MHASVNQKGGGVGGVAISHTERQQLNAALGDEAGGLRLVGHLVVFWGSSSSRRRGGGGVCPGCYHGALRQVSRLLIPMRYAGYSLCGGGGGEMRRDGIARSDVTPLLL